jgi:hypothetical protein
MFSTYLENSFDLIASPGKQLYSPDAHCFCPICSWLVDAPNLKTKRITPADKRRAEKLRMSTLLHIALDNGISLPETTAVELIADDRIHEDSALVAYGYDLLSRMSGVANGPAILALWRGFAWTKTGSPKPKFKLVADNICDAEQRLVTAIGTVG